MSLWSLGERAHLPLVALLLIAGVGVAAASRDLMKRLLGACVAMIGAVTHLAVVTGAPTALGGALLAVAVLVTLYRPRPVRAGAVAGRLHSAGGVTLPVEYS